MTLVEARAPWSEQDARDWSSEAIAQLRFDPGTKTWALFWPRHTGRWLRYEDLPEASDVASLLAEIDADPDGVF